MGKKLLKYPWSRYVRKTKAGRSVYMIKAVADKKPYYVKYKPVGKRRVRIIAKAKTEAGAKRILERKIKQLNRKKR